MIIYLGKHHVNAAADVTSAHRIGLKLTREVEGVRHKLLFMDNYFSSPVFHTCCGVSQRLNGLWTVEDLERF
jgi:hypothetical protein